MAREILFELGKMITDRLPYKFGIKKLTESDPEYIILDRACSNDEIAEIMLKMGLRKPKTTAEIAHLTDTKTGRIHEGDHSLGFDICHGGDEDFCLCFCWNKGQISIKPSHRKLSIIPGFV